MWINDKEFQEVLERTPLISIDLIIQDNFGRVLLGRRLNRPAQGFWFVPGGRVRKGERLQEAFRRILQGEVNALAEMAEARFLGVFEHLYDDTTFGDVSSGTHYVVMAYMLVLDDSGEKIAADKQHSCLSWWTMDEAKTNPEVHAYTKAYLEHL